MAASLNPRGRPVGSINYGGISLVAKFMKRHGLIWLDEMAECYKRYRDESLALTAEQKQRGERPDAAMLTFWTVALPFLSLKMDEKLSRGWKKRVQKRRISGAAMEALTKLEGRAE